MSNKTHGEIWISMLTLVDHPECSLWTDAHRISHEECVCVYLRKLYLRKKSRHHVYSTQGHGDHKLQLIQIETSKGQKATTWIEEEQVTLWVKI